MPPSFPFPPPTPPRRQFNFNSTTWAVIAAIVLALIVIALLAMYLSAR